MANALSRFVKAVLAPPAYIAFPAAGIAISDHSVRVVTLTKDDTGLIISRAGEERIRTNARSVEEGIAELLYPLSRSGGVRFATISLPSSKATIGTAVVRGSNLEAWITELSNRSEEWNGGTLEDDFFDIEPLALFAEGTRVIGMAAPKRFVERRIETLVASGITVRAIEHEAFALCRAVLPQGTEETLLVLDIGRTNSFTMLAERGMPTHVEQIAIGGLQSVRAIQQELGVTESEARRIRGEEGGIAPRGHYEYERELHVMKTTLREKLLQYRDYISSRDVGVGVRPKITRVLITGEDAYIRGLPEFLQEALRIPVSFGDVFTNLAPKESWLPPLTYDESLGYGVAIGLALKGTAL